MRLGLAPLKAMLLGWLVVMMSSPAMTLTPKRSPEQLAKDEALFARASQAITPKVMQCFPSHTGPDDGPFKVRFFLSMVDQSTSQFAILGSDAAWRPARSRRERAAVRAIRTCGPFGVPEELRNWGGFWLMVEFR